MKLAVLFSLLAFVSIEANASRWILKNPSAQCVNNLKQANRGDTKTLKLVKNTYLLLEGNQEKNVEKEALSKACPGTRILADFIVPFVPPKINRAISREAWHVKDLNYAEYAKKELGKNVIVAVIDTGVDTDHPALKSKIWVNKKEIAGNGVDDDKNGYIDDVNGFNFVDKTNNVKDDHGHGTHCSGLVGGAPKDESANSPRGLAPYVTIMPVKIFKGSSGASFLGLIEAIKYAADSGAKVMSNSWGFKKRWQEATEEHMNLMKESIQFAGSKGAVFVAAAANDGKNLDPLVGTDNMTFPVGFGKDLDNVVGVAASTIGHTRASFSNYGPQVVHVAAPGQDIISSIRGGQWGSMSGTSMATPIVAGLVAAGMSKGLRNKEIIKRLIASATTDAHWETLTKSKGIINLKKFLD